jgi:hypothetical protein
MKKISLLLLLAFSFFKASASHAEGGQIRYEYSGSGTTYVVFAEVFGTCAMNGGGSSLTISITGPSSYSTTVSAPLVKTDTLFPYCPGTLTTCTSPSGSNIGSFVGHYQVAVTLPTIVGVYRFSYSISARNASVNIAGGNMYVEAMLDNTTSFNSSPVVPNFYPVVLPLGATVSTPLHAIDLEGDSIAYEFVRPQDGYNNLIAWTAASPPYTLSAPMSGASVCSMATGSMVTKSGTNTGPYVLAIRIKDYRKGVLVGYTNRDFIINVLNGGSSKTIPVPASPLTLMGTTCPGTVHNDTLRFTDPTTTDSVYVTVTPPTISGWTFIVTPLPGIGTGAAAVSWTTPTSMNPATLPYLLFPVFVRDNGCTPRAKADYMRIVYTSQCMADSVWPGDANGDKTVNIYDPLAIAIAYGETGTARIGASTTWVAQACAPWSNSFINLTNMKHADCDGNGIVNAIDLSAVTSNWGLTYPKGNDNPRNKVTGLPDLYFDHTGIKFTPGTTVTVPIKLGSSASPMNNIYGYSTKVYVDGITLAAAPSFTYTGSWLGTSGTTLNFVKKISNNVVEWAYARTTHNNISGQGTIAQIVFTVPSSATPGTKIYLHTSNEKMIDKDGNDVTNFNVIYDTVVVEASVGNVIGVNSIIQYANVVPNPSQNNAQLFIAANADSKINIIITDVMGKQISVQSQAITQGLQYVNLPENISSGMYTVCIENREADVHQQLKWIKQ